MKKIAILIISAFTISACFAQQLRPGAGQVRILYQDSNASQCKLVSKIDTGNYNVDSYQDAQIVLRNIAYQMGANAIQIENIQAGKIASARALRCSGYVLDKNSTSTNKNNTNSNHTKNGNNNQTNNRNNFSSNKKFEISGDFVKFENQIWQRCGYGQFMANNTCQGSSAPLHWKAAMKYCNNLKLQGKNWKLPTSDELQKLLINKPNADIKIDLVAFPRSEASLYWTSSVYEKSSQVVWTVDFKSATSFAFGSSNTAYVRCISLN